MKNKLLRNIYIIIFVFVFSMSLGIFINYYNNNIKDKKYNIIEKKYNLLINYDKTDSITLKDLKYNSDLVYTFKINNFSKDTIGKYKVIFDVITPASNIIDENLVYTLEGKTNVNDNSSIVVNKSETPLPIVTKELGLSSITPGDTHEYKLTLKLKNNNKDYLKDKVFTSVIRIEDISE